MIALLIFLMFALIGYTVSTAIERYNALARDLVELQRIKAGM